MQVTEGWVGANTESEARRLIENKFPGCTILKVYRKLSGMWSFEVKEKGQAGNVPFDDRKDETPEESLDEEPPEDEPEGLESDVF